MHSWIRTCALILGRNHSNVKHAGYALVRVDVWKITSALILRKNHSNVKYVDYALLRVDIWKFTCALILTRNHSNVKHVDYSLLGATIWRDIFALILGRTRTDHVKCGICLVRVHLNSYWGYTIRSLVMPIILCWQWIIEESFAFTLMGNPSSVAMWIMFCSEWTVEQLSAHSHKGKHLVNVKFTTVIHTI